MSEAKNGVPLSEEAAWVAAHAAKPLRDAIAEGDDKLNKRARTFLNSKANDVEDEAVARLPREREEASVIAQTRELINAGFRESLKQKIFLNPATLKKIEEINLNRRPKLWRKLIGKEARPQFDVELLQKVIEYGAHRMIDELCDGLLEAAHEESSYKSMTIDDLRNAQERIDFAINEIIKIDEPGDDADIGFYDAFAGAKDEADPRLNFEGIGRAATRFSEGRLWNLAGVFKIIHGTNEGFDEKDAEFLNQIMPAIRAKANIERSIKELDAELAKHGIACLEVGDEWVYQKIN